MSEIVVVGSFDSKAEPLRLLIEHMKRGGQHPIVIDTSVFPGNHDVTFSAAETARRAGFEHGQLASKGRAQAVRMMSDGAATILLDLLAEGKLGALVCMGGSNAATVFSRLVEVIPLGIPKILMSTAIAGDTRPMFGAADAILIYPVVDIEGENAILAQMIERLAQIAIAVRSGTSFADLPASGRMIAVTMYGVTTPCAQRLVGRLKEHGFEPLVFHANGTGGRSVERFAAQKVVDAVIDLTLAELGNEILGGAFPAGPDRFSNAARCGIPQVLAPGAIDMIAFGPRKTVPEKFADHQIHVHNDLVTLVRTRPEECRLIGKALAERLGEPEARTAVCIPLGGTSMLDRPGEPFWDPDAVQAFRDGLSEHCDRRVEVIEDARNINDPEFADLLFDQLAKAWDCEARPRSS
jgi:uncharacterized protein (UPF0261 family)